MPHNAKEHRPLRHCLLIPDQAAWFVRLLSPRAGRRTNRLPRLALAAVIAVLPLIGAGIDAQAANGCFGLRATIRARGQITGTPGDDIIIGSSGNDVIDGGGGNDTIAGGQGSVCCRGTIVYNAGNWLNGGPGNDIIIAGSGEPGAWTENSLAGDDAENSLDGGRDSDIDVCIHSQTGVDTFINCDVEE